MPNGLQHSSRLDAGPLLREERTSIIRCLRSAFDPQPDVARPKAGTVVSSVKRDGTVR
jgi:hypothetical protein